MRLWSYPCLPRVNDDQSLLADGLGHPFVLNFLATLHALLVRGRLSHGGGIERIGSNRNRSWQQGLPHFFGASAATHLTSRSASSLVLYIENPTRSNDPPGIFKMSTGRGA